MKRVKSSKPPQSLHVVTIELNEAIQDNGMIGEGGWLYFFGFDALEVHSF